MPCKISTKTLFLKTTKLREEILCTVENEVFLCTCEEEAKLEVSSTALSKLRISAPFEQIRYELVTKYAYN